MMQLEHQQYNQQLTVIMDDYNLFHQQKPVLHDCMLESK